MICGHFSLSMLRVQGVYVGARESWVGWRRHLVIWSRNHEYSILMRNDLRSYYQSLGSKFRYILGKVLGTQDRPTLRLASHHCVLCFNPIKNHLNTCILDSHTHSHDIFNPKQTYLSIYPNKREPNKRNPNHTSNIWKTLFKTKHGNKQNISDTKSQHIRNPNHTCKKT